MSEIFSAEKFFVDAINANPEDRDTRRAHIDWLLENDRGDEAGYWLKLADKRPAKEGEVRGGGEAGWYYVGFPYLSPDWVKSARPFEAPDKKHYDAMTFDEKETYNPFFNLSALVRVMQQLDQTNHEDDNND